MTIPFHTFPVNREGKEGWVKIKVKKMSKIKVKIKIKSFVKEVKMK